MANMQILGEATLNSELKGMGTTVCVLLETQGFIYIAHVGDSRIYLHSDNKLYRKITKDHSYVQSLVDAGEILDSEMESHPRKNELTRALGISQEVDVEVISKPILAKKGDKFLLCTDGLCGLVNDRELLQIINNTDDLNEVVDQLIIAAKNAGGHDNITVDLIEVLESDYTKTVFQSKNPKNNISATDPSIGSSIMNTEKQNPGDFVKKGFLNKIINDNKLIKIIASIILLFSVGIIAFFMVEQDDEKQSNTSTSKNTSEQTNDFEVDLIESLKTLKNEGDGKAKETSKYYYIFTNTLGCGDLCEFIEEKEIYALNFGVIPL